MLVNLSALLGIAAQAMALAMVWQMGKRQIRQTWREAWDAWLAHWRAFNWRAELRRSLMWRQIDEVLAG